MTRLEKWLYRMALRAVCVVRDHDWEVVPVDIDDVLALPRCKRCHVWF